MATPVPITFVSGHAVLGGGESVMRSLIERLGREWVRNVVILEDGPFPAALRDAGMPVTVVPTGRRIGAPAGAVALRRLLRRDCPALVHANGAKAAAVCDAALPRLSARLVWMKHDTTFDGPLAWAIAARCARVVGVSETVVETFPRPLRGCVTVVHNGLPERAVDSDAARRLTREVAGCAPGDPVVVLSGRISIGKGQLELVEAIPSILATHPSARFVLVGGDDTAFPGHREAIMERTAELGVERSAVLLGHRWDAVEIVAGADLLVAPSVRDQHGWQEGFGLAVAEALQVGTPVVGYRSGSLPEILGDCAALVEEGDRAGLATEVVRLLDDDDARAALAACGRERVRDRFRLDDAVARMRAIYAHVASER